MEGYQVSAQCMALVRDDCLVPTKDAPELGYVRESSDKQYVPDVFYKVSQKKHGFFFLSLSFISFMFFSSNSITSCPWDLPFFSSKLNFIFFVVD